MLVLSRRESERIRLGESIVVTVVRVSGDKVRLGIEAPGTCWCCGMSSSRTPIRRRFLPRLTEAHGPASAWLDSRHGDCHKVRMVASREVRSNGSR